MLEYSLWDRVLNIYNIYILDVLLHGYIEDLEWGERGMEGGGGVDPRETIFLREIFEPS